MHVSVAQLHVAQVRSHESKGERERERERKSQRASDGRSKVS